MNSVGFHFLDLRFQTRYRRFRGRRVSFSCFALPDSFSVVPWASAPIFMFCASELVFGGTDGVGSRFHVFAPGHIFGGAEGVGSRFHVLCSRTRFRRFRGRRVQFSCFASSQSFSTIPRASGPVFIFCAPEHSSLFLSVSFLSFSYLISECMRANESGVCYSDLYRGERVGQG
jgi:hypothetical protein